MVANIIVGLIILIILFFAVGYIYKAKKQGANCIGCPHGKTCKGNYCQTLCYLKR